MEKGTKSSGAAQCGACSEASLGTVAVNVCEKKHKQRTTTAMLFCNDKPFVKDFAQACCGHDMRGVARENANGAETKRGMNPGSWGSRMCWNGDDGSLQVETDSDLVRVTTSAMVNLGGTCRRRSTTRWQGRHNGLKNTVAD